MKCETCKNNWEWKDQRGFGVLSYAIDTCNFCKQHEFRLYEPIDQNAAPPADTQSES